MPNLYGYDIVHIVAGLKILNNISDFDDQAKKAIDLFIDIIISNTDRKRLHGKLRFKCDKFELWKFILDIKSSLQNEESYEILKQKKGSFISKGLGKIHSLFLYIFQPISPKHRLLSLKNLLLQDFSFGRELECSAYMLNLLQEQDQEKALYLTQEIIGAIISSIARQELYLKPLLDGKNFIELLLSNIRNHSKHSILYAHILYWIVNYDDLFVKYDSELLVLFQTLNEYPVIKRYVYKALKRVLERKHMINELDAIIDHSKYKDRNFNSKLIELYFITDQSTKDGYDIIRNLIDINLLELLYETFGDPILLDTFKPDDVLVYDAENCGLYVKSMLIKSVNHPIITNKALDMNAFQEVDTYVLQTLLTHLNALKSSALSNEELKYHFSAIAHYICSIPTELYEAQMFNINIDDIRKLGKYYACLISIQKTFMSFSKNNKEQALELLINSLAGV